MIRGSLIALSTLLTSSVAAQTASVDPAIRKIAAEISPDRINSTVKTLAGFATRGNYSDPNQKARGIGAARGWILAQFRSYSPRLEVSLDTAKKGNTDIVSIIAALPGVTQPEKHILVAAHYDSMNAKTSAAEAPAPGADDDASGTAVVLELARVMSQYRFRKTIVFIAFAGEEVGLIGSSHYAAHAQASHEQIEAVFNNDIVGTNGVAPIEVDLSGNGDKTDISQADTSNRLRIYSPDPPDSPSRRLARYIQDTAGRYVPILRIDLFFGADRYGRGGDHIPFQKSGFAAVRITSASENSDVQHTADDTPDGVSPTFAADVARVNGTAIASLATPAASR